MTLRSWVQNGWLHHHTTNKNEIASLMKIVERDLHDCETTGLSNDWKLNIAYNAALQVAKVALCATGFRASHDAHHYRVIQSLLHTIRAEKGLVAELDGFRKKRNVTDYEQAGMVSDLEVNEMFHLAVLLKSKVIQFIKENYPQFLP